MKRHLFQNKRGLSNLQLVHILVFFPLRAILGKSVFSSIPNKIRFYLYRELNADEPLWLQRMPS